MQVFWGHHRQVLAAAIAVVLLLLVAGAMLAQVSPNFDASEWVVAGGGGTRQSPSFAVEDTIGEPSVGDSTSPSFLVSAGFQGGLLPGSLDGDDYEDDDQCTAATEIAVDGSKQAHNFHVQGDQDWLKFTAAANKTYEVRVTNLGAKADAIIALHDTCDLQLDQSEEAFGASTVTLSWDSLKSGTYFVKLQQFDPSIYGSDANYEVSVVVDTQPPSAPESPRCLPISGETLGIQWKKSPERDVRRYRIQFTGAISGNEDVQGGDTTYYELGGLTPNQSYTLRVRAVDFSGNESPPTGEVICTAQEPDDTSTPSFSLQQPAGGAVYTTTAGSLTFNGNAQDAGGNLSRANVKNLTRNTEGWDYSLSGSSDTFRVADLALGIGDNNVRVSVIDDAGNSSQKNVTVRRLGGTAGAVIIVAGHNETFGLQNNIYNSTNRAYRIFKGAGFSDDNIYYIAPVAQDADGDGSNDVDATASPSALEQAITSWAAQGGRVGPEKALFIYLMDHGFVEKYCVAGCSNDNSVSPTEMDTWLRQLEDATGVDEVTVVIEACQSGSFIDRVAGDAKDSLSKAGRVVISSTSRNNNAYASAQGAYFSDAFFSCLADSNDLKTCFDQARSAVLITGVAQEPWLDDNGDGAFNAGDGSVAQGRIVTRFFSSIRPEILTTELSRDGKNGTLTATVDEGAEEMDVVWAAVYPPSFKEPDASAGDVTLNLGVPTVRLEAVDDSPGKFAFDYVNGFLEEGDYRIVFYAQDRTGIQAIPKLEGEQLINYLPVLHR